MSTQDDRIAASVILKCSVEYLAGTSPDGSHIEPGALRSTSSVVRNVYLALIDEMAFIPSAATPAPVAAPASGSAVAAAGVLGSIAPVVAASRQVSAGVDFAGEGKFTKLPIQVQEFDPAGQKTASTGTPYLRFKSAKGQWWTLWDLECIATAQAAGSGGFISCGGSVSGKFNNIQETEILPAGGAI